MQNAISVLLIIGSAVVGPIEAQQTGSNVTVGGPPAEIAGRVGRQAGRAACLLPGESMTGKTVDGPCRPESLPELCERAMRDIGIDTKNQGGFMSYGYKTDGAKFVYAFGAWSPMKTAQDDWQVRCVPVPQGHKR